MLDFLHLNTVHGPCDVMPEDNIIDPNVTTNFKTF